MKLLKLALNPFEPNHQQIGDLHMMVHAPYAKAGLIKETHPKLDDLLVDEMHPEMPVRRVLVSFMCPGIGEYEFDLDALATHRITIKNKSYEITLTEIGEEEIQQFKAQKFLYFIFNVEEI